MSMSDFIARQIAKMEQRRLDMRAREKAHRYRFLPNLTDFFLERAERKRVRKGAIRLYTWTGARRTTRGKKASK